ncbi:DUF2231 domain-containing protein [Flavobacterium sp. UMI-01]|uniref:DUF2231 domain-containing protein n=1 Tax=Flavobacterium sp. UMI-01 TaxID=1441053 RepID=UPI001C7DFCD2|nr:DUF2231 domain-containing protein [Flavobacterium sp. UMI-01]GIZ08204.1 hypothetical protein FUMI01_09310 [Flavobacterium sp. UMI-01]
MNDAHLHLMVNHFPIVGLIFGFGILISGLYFRNNGIKNTAYSLFVVAAITAFLSMATGEGAEEIVEDMPNIGHHIIHEHEEYAEKFALILYALGLLSLYGFYLNVKTHTRARLISIIVLVMAGIGLVFALQTGTSGGEIRHTEIREVNPETIPVHTPDGD